MYSLVCQNRRACVLKFSIFFSSKIQGTWFTCYVLLKFNLTIILSSWSYYSYPHKFKVIFLYFYFFSDNFILYHTIFIVYYWLHILKSLKMRHGYYLLVTRNYQTNIEVLKSADALKSTKIFSYQGHFIVVKYSDND